MANIALITNNILSDSGTALTSVVTGSGTTNYLSKFTGSTALGNSIIYDNGTAVGIGTSSPSGLLHLYKNNAPVVLRLQSASPYAYPGDFTIQTGGYGSNDFIIYDNINSAERFYINNAGNVGIGTTSPIGKLDVDSTGYSIYANNSSGNRIVKLGTQPSSGEPAIQATLSNGTPRYLLINPDGGNVLIGTTTDAGYKLNVNGSAYASTLTDGYITISGAQINRTSGTVELQFNGSDSVRIFGNTAYPITFASGTGVTTVSNLGGSGTRMVVADSAGTLSTQSIPGGVSGSGTTSYVPKWTSSSALGNSLLYDDGTNIGIGTTNPTGQMSGTTGLGIFHASYPALGLRNASYQWLNYLDGSYYKLWNAGAGDVMSITYGGNILIGTTTDNGSKLQVNGTGRFSGGILSERTIDALSGLFLRSNIDGSSIFNNGIILGKSTSTNDAASIVYTHVSNGSSSNRLGLGFWNADNLLNLTASGNVGIGTTSPTSPLEITNTGSAGGGISMYNSSYSSTKQWGTRTYGIDNGSGIYWATDVQFSSTWYNAIRVGHGQNANNPSLQSYYSTYLATNGGNVLIGTTTDGGWKLNVNGNARIGSNTSQNTIAALAVSAGEGGSSTTYRDIDLHGGWVAGEGHAITASHGSNSTNMVGQIVFQHDSPGSRIKFGRLYNSGDQSTYPMELVSTGSNAILRLNTDSYTLYGPNSTWGTYLQVGGNGRVTTNASVVTTNGNLHLDSADGGYLTYINYYSQGNTTINTQGGNVLIGTSTDAGQKLQVNGSGNFNLGNSGYIKLKSGSGQRNGFLQSAFSNFLFSNNVYFDGSGWKYEQNGFGAQIQTETLSSGVIAFNTFDFGFAGSYGSIIESMRIVNNGNILMGDTTDYGFKLQVNGTSIFSDTIIQNYGNNPNASRGITSYIAQSNLTNDYVNGYYSGETISGELASTVSAGQVVAMKANSLQWELADASTAASIGKNMIGIACYDGNSTDVITILLNGFFASNTYYNNSGNYGVPMYLNASTNGSLTDVAPSTTGNIVRIVGHIDNYSNSNGCAVVRFNPDNSWLVI